jgi:hypothetical protein
LKRLNSYLAFSSSTTKQDISLQHTEEAWTPWPLETVVIKLRHEAHQQVLVPLLHPGLALLGSHLIHVPIALVDRHDEALWRIICGMLLSLAMMLILRMLLPLAMFLPLLHFCMLLPLDMLLSE